jgi:hypothetical protein
MYPQFSFWYSHRGRLDSDRAAAERRGISALHDDRAFDMIAELTGQPVEWVVGQPVQ